MADNNCGEILDALLGGVDSVLATKTVVGEATHIDDTIIVPLVDVNFFIGAGASLSKDAAKKGGGGGAVSAKMSPNSVLVIKDGVTKLVNIKNQDTVSKIADMVPEVIDKITNSKKKKKMPSDEACAQKAFSDDNK